MKVRKRRRRILATGMAFLLVVASAAAQDASTPRVLSARDTLRINQVGAPALSPDGEWVVYTLRTRDMDDPELEAVTHLWRVRADGTGNRQLTRGAKSATAPAWSPDSDIIAFLAARGEEADAGTQVHFLYADGGEAWQVTEHDEAVRFFSFAPDGRTIAFASNATASSNTLHDKLYLVEPEGGAARVLLEDVDRDFSVPIWSADGRYVFWPTGEGTATSLFRVSLESGAVLTGLAPGGRNSAWELSDDGTRWVWVHTSPDWPAEIYTAAVGGDPVRLTDANAWLREEGVRLGKVETVRWTNSDGDPVEGVLTKPVGYEEGNAYPEQSVEFYRALRDLGKDVTFVRFPREGHGIVEPLHQMDRLRRYAAFFGEHVDNPPISEQQPHEAAPPADGEER